MISGVSVTAGGTAIAAACAPATAGGASAVAARGFLVAIAFPAGVFRFLVLAGFLPADFDFRIRTAFFAFDLRFVGMGIPPR